MSQQRPHRFITNDAAFCDLLGLLAKERAFALDTEANSFFVYYERVCLVQLSTRAEDFIVDPFAVDLKPLGPLLADPAIEKVLHAADYDLRCLDRDYGFRVANLFDTMLAARLAGAKELGLAALVKARFGATLSKKYQRSDWGQRPLTEEQLAYATLDTQYLLALRDQLGAELAAAGKMDEAGRQFERQCACRYRKKPFDVNGFRRLQGFRQLSPQGREVAKALYLLREEKAREYDRPPFKIYGDTVIVELAQRMPASLAEVEKVPGLGKSTLGRMGEAIVVACAGGAGQAGQ